MVKVMCDGEKKEVSVYSKCAFCTRCEAVIVGRREMPNPMKKALTDGKLGGGGGDEGLQNAQMTFNLFIRDGSALICNDDKNEGFLSLYSY